MTPRTAGAAALDSLEALVAAAAARCLRTPEASVDPDAPLILIGLDSLAAIELAADLERAVGCTLPADLLYEYTDVRSLAARLRHLQAARPPVIAEDPRELMLADARLPSDVRPAPCRDTEAGFGAARRILLTGATGFLGAALARDLLQNTSASLVCLVRSAPGGNRSDRLRRQLAAAGIGDDLFGVRVQPIEGDLTRPRLGMDAGRFDALARSVDAICHAGASVNWVCSYATLRHANVLATIELLRLACAAGARSTPFHFVSSLSVCHSTSGPRLVDEQFDALPHLGGVHLGYAQTKVVAEALVRQAAQRGLPVRVYRPGLISGDSRTGAFNRDDLLSTLVRGCVHMRAAPDLDWLLDVQPVDFVSKAIVYLSSAPGPTFHLAHDRPRHWREVVLWMRLYGYPIHLVTYHEWLRQLERATSPSCPTAPSHPLRALRSFFLERPPGEQGLTLPELYEETRRSRVAHDRTSHALAGGPLACPPLDAVLLGRYFEAFVASGSLPAPPPSAGMKDAATGPRARASLSFDVKFFARVLPGFDVVSVQPLGNGSEHSIIGELVSWRCGQPAGLFRFRLGLNGAAGRCDREVIVKVKPRDLEPIAVGEALARLCDPAVADCYARWRDRVGLSLGHLRELAIYQQTDPRFVRHSPRVLGMRAEPEAGTWLVVLERIADAVLMNASDRPEDWTTESIALAIDGLAALQAIWFGREAELRGEPWIGYVQSADGMAQMADLWAALAHHAAPTFSSWADPSIASIHRRLVSTAGRWWAALERGPGTLIHRDFNPRNICIRGSGNSRRLCAYDWELATLGAPQRDLAELLCFVLPPDAPRNDVEHWVERHRQALVRETGAPLDDREWREGFRAALYDLLIDRLAMYALIHRIRRQPFLPRVVRTWRRLYQWFPQGSER